MRQPDVRPVPVAEDNGFAYYLCQAFDVSFKYGGDAVRFQIPDGFVFDGTSVPRAAWTLSGIERDGLERRAALIHDWLYAHQGKVPGNDRAFTREGCDLIFYEHLLASGVSKSRAIIMHKFVRMFGGAAW
jgi:hypothetical protein